MSNYLPVILGCCLVQGIMAKAAENPYKIILQRNAFGLGSPPTNIVSVPLPPADPPPTIKFSGISALRGEKRAWFILTGPKPGDKPDYWDLVVGHRKGI